MIQTVKDIISTFDRLPLSQQNEVAKQILRRSLEIETPEISDDELIFAAEEIFMELDEREAVDA